MKWLCSQSWYLIPRYLAFLSFCSILARLLLLLQAVLKPWTCVEHWREGGAASPAVPMAWGMTDRDCRVFWLPYSFQCFGLPFSFVSSPSALVLLFRTASGLHSKWLTYPTDGDEVAIIIYLYERITWSFRCLLQPSRSRITFLSFPSLRCHRQQHLRWDPPLIDILIPASIVDQIFAGYFIQF